MTQEHRTHALYRFYAADAALLYVGITLNPGQRWPAHRDDKPWWHEVANITVETHPSRQTVLEAEHAAIIAEKPRYNVVHNRGAGTTGSRQTTYEEQELLLLEMVGAPPESGPFGADPRHMPDDCHDVCVRHGINSIYYPYMWRNGRAHYLCQHGHHWTCSWGHDHSGVAMQWHGRPAGGCS